MKHAKRYGATNLPSCERDLLLNMISDLDRLVRLLDCDIAKEEERFRVSNRADPAYPMLARTLSTRRDNLKSTIAALENRLVTVEVTSFDRLHTAA